MDKSNICFIRAKQRGDDYCFDGIRKNGYEIDIPYKDTSLLFRVMREFCFRTNILPKSIWFNKKVLRETANIFIVKDPLICEEYLKWLKEKKPNARVIFDYDNLVSRTLSPERIPIGVEKWSFDPTDCEKYNMKLKHGAYFDIYKIEHEPNCDIDVLYLGRDKGRAGELLDVETTFKKMGLKTHFHICADRSFMRYKSKRYKPVIPYSEYLDLLKRSNAVLNITQPGQKSLTMREFEAVFDNVKCITNNLGILESDLYDKTRYFILGVDDIDKLPAFLKSPFKKVPEDLLEQYRFDSYVQQIVEDSQNNGEE